jgi:hypothetical protein
LSKTAAQIRRKELFYPAPDYIPSDGTRVALDLSLAKAVTRLKWQNRIPKYL